MLDIGLGLWAMQATASHPATWTRLYAELQEDARLAEALDFHSLWLPEHHFWYDGWCPQPLIAAAASIGATEQLHVGVGVYILPLHDHVHGLRTAEQLHRLSDGRLELAVGLGYRDYEYDGFGLPRQGRGNRMDVALDAWVEAWTGRHSWNGPRVWIGGFGEIGLGRGISRSLSLLLPPTLNAREIRTIVKRSRQQAGRLGVEMGRVGVIRNAWVVSEPAAEADMRLRIATQHREYSGAWWLLDGKIGFDRPDSLNSQMQRVADTAVVGTPDQMTAALHDLRAAGIDLVILQIATDATRPEYRDNMELIASEILPAFKRNGSS